MAETVGPNRNSEQLSRRNSQPPTPLLILSDSPSCTSGLGRITRDIATRISEHMQDTFRVACLGYGGTGSARLPFHQYHIHDVSDWVVPELPLAWDDWCGSESGILLTIWDPSRLRWLARPNQNTQLGAWVSQQRQAGMMKLWGYIPVDATGPHDKLTAVIADTLKGYDRILAYSEWAAAIIGRTIGEQPESRPHGLDTAVWNPRDRLEARKRFRTTGFVGLQDSSFLVGIVATNQSRKDFGLGFETCAKLLAQGLDLRLWIHTDTIQRHWDLVALCTDFGLLGRVVITTSKFTDEEMAWMYSACDVTLGIGLGEGFGYPIFESLACGVPCVHGDYGGAPEHMPDYMKVQAIGWRLDGQFDCIRPVFKSDDWVKAATLQQFSISVGLPPELDWNNLWPHWQGWLEGGQDA